MKNNHTYAKLTLTALCTIIISIATYFVFLTISDIQLKQKIRTDCRQMGHTTPTQNTACLNRIYKIYQTYQNQ